MRKPLRYWLLYWKRRVSETLAEIEGVPLHAVFIKDSYVFPLLNLRVWGIRYHVTLKFILQFLLSYYKNLRKHNVQNTIRRRFVTLGVPVSVLCGKKSRILVEQEVVKQFPRDEQDKVHRSRILQKAARITHPCYMAASGNLYKDVKRYRKALAIRHRRLVSTSKFKRRAWRDNPWL